MAVSINGPKGEQFPDFSVALRIKRLEFRVGLKLTILFGHRTTIRGEDRP